MSVVCHRVRRDLHSKCLVSALECKASVVRSISSSDEFVKDALCGLMKCFDPLSMGTGKVPYSRVSRFSISGAVRFSLQDA